MCSILTLLLSVIMLSVILLSVDVPPKYLQACHGAGVGGQGHAVGHQPASEFIDGMLCFATILASFVIIRNRLNEIEPLILKPIRVGIQLNLLRTSQDHSYLVGALSR